MIVTTSAGGVSMGKGTFEKGNLRVEPVELDLFLKLRFHLFFRRGYPRTGRERV